MTNTICLLGDGEPTKAGQLIPQYNKAAILSPNGIPGMVITTGDMTKSTGTNMSFTINDLKSSSLSGAEMHFVSGNHEYDDRSSAWTLMIANRGKKYPLTIWTGDSSGLTYHFKTVDNINIFMLNIYYNNADGKVSQAMFDWLSQELSTTIGYKIVCLHDPLYPYKYHIGNSLDADPVMRDKLQKLFESKNVNIVFVGHAHYSNILDKNGVLHVNTGTILKQGTGDSFNTVNYLHINTNNQLVLTVTNDINGTPKNIIKIIGAPTPPQEIITCSFTPQIQ